MGVDIVTLTGHNLEAKAIIQLPKVIDSWMELRSIDISNGCFEEAHWDRDFTEEELLASWSSQEVAYSENRLYDEDYFHSAFNLTTYFGSLVFNRKTVLIRYFPQHKYANLFYPDICREVLLFSRMLAKRFEQDKIVYCVDSSYPTARIETPAIEGKTIEQVIHLGNKAFGIPPESLTEGIKNLYFIDFVHSPLQDSLPINWNECRFQ